MDSHRPANSHSLEARVEQAAAACAANLPAEADAFATDRIRFERSYQTLLKALRDYDVRHAYDRDGRPGAIEVIRAALPSTERELLQAVIDDFTCELAAVQEALYRVAMAGRPAQP
jgi:erythromycin esterase-like protein